MSEVKVNKISPRTNCGTTQLGDAGDTITVTGDLKSNSLKSASGSTITLGQSGDTIQLGCGASQTGFGRTGTVDWDTTAKTASFTAVSGNGYFVNTTSAAITLTLPASPSAGDIVAFKDYAFTFATNNLSVDGNSAPIGGVDGADPVVYSTNGTSKTFIYVDGTKGWLVTNESTDTSQESDAQYVTATGGTVTCCGDYKIHTFTSPGTFCVSCGGNACGSNTVDYMVIAGGGGGGSQRGGGGGAGGFRESSGAASGCYTASPLGSCVSALPVTVQGYPITVGGGGGSPGSPFVGVSGSNSVFSTITSAGGGGGGFGPNPGAPGAGVDGGSGGGGGSVENPSPGSPGGTGNTPPVSPPQGQPGAPSGPGPTSGGEVGAGGGGAICAGASNPAPNLAGDGGDGATTSISGSPTAYAGGGGGGNGALTGCNGGAGGGGRGGGKPGVQPYGNCAAAGTANTGGGGGGGGDGGPSGAAGGSGIVIIRYKYQ